MKKILVFDIFSSLAYSSHIPTPGGPPSNYSSSNSLGGGPGDNSALGSHVYSPMNITPATPGAQYAPMSAAMGKIILS